MTEMNFAQARFNMVEQQIRTWDVLDQRVLDIIAATPREAFVPEAFRRLAYADIAIELGHGQVMMKPILEARMVQSLAIEPGDTVLEVGTGSGYVTALLAGLGQRIDSVEIVPELNAQAQARLAAQGIGNATLHVGDAANGWDAGAPYDAIAITGSFPVGLPEGFLQQLKVGGRLFAVIGENPIMEARLVRRISETEWTHECLFETSVPALLNVPQPQRFFL